MTYWIVIITWNHIIISIWQKYLIAYNCAPKSLKQLYKIYKYHHHVVPQAQISLTLYRHFSLSFIASGRSSGPHPVSSHSCWMYVWAGCPAFVRPYVGVHRSISLMRSSLLLHSNMEAWNYPREVDMPLKSINRDK